MTVVLPLKFQVGARTLWSVRRRLERVAFSLDDALAGAQPALPPLAGGAQGYIVTSLPADHADAVIRQAGGLVLVRQRYTRRWIDLTIGHDAYLARLSGNTRSAIRRKARKLAAASGGTLDVRRFRTPDELAVFHPIARALAERTYQEKLMGAGLPGDPASVERMLRLAAAGRAWAWLLHVGEAPAAYLFCPAEGGTVRYDYVGHDPAFNDLSPGAVLQIEALGDLFGQPDLRRFDFTEGDGQHKRQFATDGVDCVDLLLLRPTLANRSLLGGLAGFDGAMALAKRGVARLGLEKWAKKVRRA